MILVVVTIFKSIATWCIIIVPTVGSLTAIFVCLNGTLEYSYLESNAEARKIPLEGKLIWDEVNMTLFFSH